MDTFHSWISHLITAMVLVITWRLLVPVAVRAALWFPVTATLVRLGWRAVADACGLADRRRRPVRRSELGELLWGSDGRPRSGVQYRILAPGMRQLRPTRFGWTCVLRLRPGQTPDDVVRVADRLAHSWAAHAVRVSPWGPGRVRLVVNRRDPLLRVAVPAQDGQLLRVRIGRLDTGRPWILDFRVVPHWLIAGATQSGKSTLLNAVIVGLAPQPVALVGFDLKGGMEFTPYAPRMSALATTRGECVDVLRDLVSLLATRMGLCRAHGARDIWTLPADVERPVPIVVLVDEVAELFLMATRDEKAEISETATHMIRVAQLGRALGVHLVVAGQRIGSDLGPGVTALRSQLSGRVCHRVNDPETASMTLGGLDPAALDAARAISAAVPGVAVVASDSSGWNTARAGQVTTATAEATAGQWSDLAVPWEQLLPAVDLDLDLDLDPAWLAEGSVDPELATVADAP
ncbi:MAG: FtsK/SpoIIIE domain-containing protein [Actinomycetes bacterium]